MAKNIDLDVGMIPCQPGDKFTSPTGKVFYQEPSIVMPGFAAFRMEVRKKAIAVVMIRPAMRVTLRYCDPAGNVIDEQMPGDTVDFMMRAAMLRMCKVLLKYMGERHPVAQAIRKGLAKEAPIEPVSGAVH